VAATNTFLIAVRFGPEACRSRNDLLEEAEETAMQIRKECPGVNWVNSYITWGRFDMIAVLQCSDVWQIQKAAMIFRSRGATTETSVAFPWMEFREKS
jgi:uncharacterized protein with GYD domain